MEGRYQRDASKGESFVADETWMLSAYSIQDR